MRTIEILPYRYLKHKETGQKISRFSVLPHGTSDDWERVDGGFTWGITDSFGRYTEGLGRVPVKTEKEARVVAKGMEEFGYSLIN